MRIESEPGQSNENHSAGRRADTPLPGEVFSQL